MKRLSLRWLLLGSVLATLALAFGAFAYYVNYEQHASRLNDIDVELIRASRSFPQDNPPPPGAGPNQLARGTDSAPGVTGPVPPLRGDDDPPARPEPVVRTEPPDDPAQPEGVDTEIALEAAGLAPVQVLLSPAGATLQADEDLPFDQAALIELSGRTGISTYEADPMHRVIVEARPSGELMVTALPLSSFEESMADLRQTLLLGGGIILALVTALLWVVTGFLSRPVTRMAATAQKIADGELATSVAPPSGSRETVGLARDLERMLNRLRGALDDATEARTTTERLLADMAHEIRTPLTSLKGYSDLYAQGMLADKAEVDHAMSRIGSESARLHTLANGMLQLARNGLADEATANFDLTAVAREVTQDLRAAHPRQDIVFEAPSNQLLVLGGRSRMHQALLNLGSNACRYNPPPSPVVIRIEQVAHRAQVRVVDHGEGIKDEEVERIFLPFYRSGTARNRNDDGGAGLGLALTRSIADQHDAVLSVETTPGGGATFVLDIPLSPSTA